MRKVPRGRQREGKTKMKEILSERNEKKRVVDIYIKTDVELD